MDTLCVDFSRRHRSRTVVDGVFRSDGSVTMLTSRRDVAGHGMIQRDRSKFRRHYSVIAGHKGLTVSREAAWLLVGCVGGVDVMA